MAQRLDSIDSGSNYKFGDKLQISNFPRSLFSLSHLNSLSFPKMSNGMLLPVLTLKTLPTDDIELSCDCLLRVLPQVVPMYSRQRIYLHAFYCRGADLWNSWNIFASKGYNGKRNLTVPTLSVDNSPDAEITDEHLYHYLYDLPIGKRVSDFYGKVDAMPAMMYFKIWRDYFMNKYFYMDNLAMLPDDDADFRLNNSGKIVSFSNSSEDTDLSQFLFRDFADDRFTSAAPSPQRGDMPTLNFSFNNAQFDPIGFNSGGSVLVQGLSLSSEKNPLGNSYRNKLRILGSEITGSYSDSSGNVYTSTNLTFSRSPAEVGNTSALYVNKDDFDFEPIHMTDFNASITLNDLRVLAINQTELEKMAHTDGSYREFGLTFFGEPSKTAVDYRPIYIGGSYQPILFSEVIQTSPFETTNEQGQKVGSPLGTYGGHGICSNNGYLGKIHCDDYGYIMVLASVMPDTYYSQGLRKEFTELTQADLVLPDRAKLGMQPILNRELYFSGNEEQDNDLFAYQDIFDEYRYLPNSVHGKLADKSKENFFPYTQSRYFDDLPTFSQSFATTKNNVRMDFLTAKIEVPYTAQFGFNIRAVRPLPYRAIPASFI